MISAPHPIRLLITNQYQFLSSMLNRFPSLLNNWIDQQEKEVNGLANIESKGDFEVYSSIYHSEISRVDSCYDEMQLFYQALLIMVYSYYESILSRIAKEETVKERPNCIAHKYGIELMVNILKFQNIFTTLFYHSVINCATTTMELYSQGIRMDKNCII